MTKIMFSALEDFVTTSSVALRDPGQVLYSQPIEVDIAPPPIICPDLQDHFQQATTPWTRILAQKYGTGNVGTNHTAVLLGMGLSHRSVVSVVSPRPPPIQCATPTKGNDSTTTRSKVVAQDPEQRQLALEHFKLLLSLILPHLELSGPLVKKALEIAEGKLSEPDAHLRRDVIEICQSLVEIIDTNRNIKALPEHRKYQRLAKTAWGHIDPHRSQRYQPQAVINVLGVDHNPLSRFNEMTWEEICTAFGFDSREYQDAWQELLIGRISAGNDRAVIAAPYQVGKTLSMLPLAVVVLAAFPERFRGKSILIIAPQVAVLDTIKADIAATGLNLKVGVIDAQRKEFGAGYDVVVASAMTLGRDDNLIFLDPTHYGLVVVDEAPFVYANFGKKIVGKLGFLDTRGRIQQNPERVLLGYTADPFTLEKVFGKGARIDNYPLGWFVLHGHLHHPIGRQVRYDASREITLINDAGETIEVPKLGHAFVDDVYRVYKAKFYGQRVMINCANIHYAELLASYFNYKEGDDFAYADHSKKTPEENREAEGKFVQNTKLKVIVGIARLAVGFRAKGAVAVINTYRTNSLRRYGQRLGRILGIHDGEAQREVYVIDMVPATKGTAENTGVVLPTLLGLEGYPGDDVDFDPIRLDIDRKSSTVAARKYKPDFETLSDEHGQLQFVPVEGGTRKFLYPTRFPTILIEILNHQFEGNTAAMAKAYEIEIADLEQYLYGRLPPFVVLEHMAQKDSDPSRWEQAWEEDSLELLNALHPLNDIHAVSVVRAVVMMARQSSLRFTYQGDKITPPHAKPLNKTEREMLKAVIQARLFNKRDIFLRRILPERFGKICSACPGERSLIDKAIASLLAFESANRDRLRPSSDTQDREKLGVQSGATVADENGEPTQQQQQDHERDAPQGEEEVVLVETPGPSIAHTVETFAPVPPEVSAVSSDVPGRQIEVDQAMSDIYPSSGVARFFLSAVTFFGISLPKQKKARKKPKDGEPPSTEQNDKSHGFRYYWRLLRSFFGRS